MKKKCANCNSLILIHVVLNFLFFYDKVALHMPRQEVTSLKTIHQESFLGIASALGSILLGFGRVAMHDKSPGSLSCDSSVCMALPIKGPMFGRALCMRCG
jgi:hypothetical protein